MILHYAKFSIYSKVMGRFSRSPWLSQTCFSSDVPGKRSKLAPLQERKMIDRVRIWARGGDGGNGCSSFRRGRHDRRGTADGGNGGRGGDVILQCSPSVWDFSSLQRHINAKKGGHGASKNMIGSRGADKVVQVPVGTVIHLVQGKFPSAVEKCFSQTLDPWDLPTSDKNSSETFFQSADMPTKLIDPTYRSASSPVSTEDGIAATITGEQLSRVSLLPQMPVPCTPSIDEVEGSECSSKEVCNVGEFVERENFTSGEEVEKGCQLDASMQYNVAELTEPDQQVVIAYGGDGGLGNVAAAKCISRKPNVIDAKEFNVGEHTQRIGSPGSEVVLMLELKSIADVGLVGMPNAGKSTLLGAMSRARPVVGDYAFTTLRPNLGNVSYEDFSITVADIPGLIRGAHENRGLGHAFLRHIERTKVLAYVVDLVAATNGRKGTPPWRQLRDLVLELEFYREGLSNRPSLVVANKIDEAGAEEAFEELKRRVHGVPIFPVCAVLAEGVSEFKEGLRKLVNGEEFCRLELDHVLLD